MARLKTACAYASRYRGVRAPTCGCSTCWEKYSTLQEWTSPSGFYGGRIRHRLRFTGARLRVEWCRRGVWKRCDLNHLPLLRRGT